MMASLVASIPSPSDNQISLGPIDLRAYGFLIALGVLAGVWLSSRRLARDGYDPEIIPNMALWVLPAAIIGARAYFVLTNWGRFSGDLASAFRVWEGGLGIPGGVALGAVVGVWWLRRNDVPLPPVFTAVALGLPLGQIIGRFGNWFNQELYGRPTDLPWAVEIAEENRVQEYLDSATFHPTFLYESLLNLIVVGIILWVEKRFKPAPGSLFTVYLVLYGIVRFSMELLRTDTTYRIAGMSRNGWIALATALGGTIAYVIMQRRVRTTT